MMNSNQITYTLDAVKNCGQFKLSENELLDNFLVVNKDRLFFEGIGAIKELDSIACDLKVRLERLEYAEQLKNKEKLFIESKFIGLNGKSSIYLLILLILIM